jgi:hypothetical protein
LGLFGYNGCGYAAVNEGHGIVSADHIKSILKRNIFMRTAIVDKTAIAFSAALIKSSVPKYYSAVKFFIKGKLHGHQRTSNRKKRYSLSFR